MSATFRRTPLAAALLSTFSIPMGVYAQEAAVPATTLPEVQVTDDRVAPDSYKPEAMSSPKFTQPLVDTPQTITVIKKEVIADQGAISLTDALRNTPGITFQAGENGNTASGDTIFMRGFDAQGSIFLDGIRDLSPAVRDVFNVEQVEVVKGPSGADNGRGTASGYINLESKTPTAENVQAASFAYGTEDRRRISADLNQVVADKIGVRLNLLGQDGGVAGRPDLERRQWGIAPSITIGMGTNTRFSLFSQHLRQDNTPDGGVSAIGVSGYRNPILEGGNSTGTVVDARPVDTENFYGLRSDFEDIRANMLTARVEHEFNPYISIRNTSRYAKVDQKRILSAPLQAPNVSDPNTPATDPPILRDDPSTWTSNRSRQASYRENEILTNQTNLRTDFKTGIFQHELSSGVELIYESQFTPTLATEPTTPAQVQTPANLYDPNPSDPAITLGKSGASIDGDVVTTALYAFDTIKLGEQWQFLGGLRWERYETETTNVAAATVSPTVPFGTPGTATVLDDSDNLLSWKTAVLFKPATNGSVYVSYANSKRPPGTDGFALTVSAPTAANPNININSQGLKPQKSENVEVGTKWDFLGGRLALTAALFSSENKNDLARQADDSVVQYGKRTVEGIELGAAGQLAPGWNVTFGYTFQDTEVKDGAQFVQANGTIVSPQDGVAINFSPKNFVNLWTTYQVPMQLPFSKVPKPLTVGGGARYVDTQTRTTALRSATAGGDGTITQANSGILFVDDYIVFDLMASYDFTQKVSLQLNGYNVFDEEYVASVNNSGQRYFPAVPVSYLLSLNVRF